MFAKALLMFLALPGTIGFVLPVTLGSFDPWKGDGYIVGAVVIVVGVVILTWCVREFCVSGNGTLAPWAPPKHLVVVGLYRYTRNPMYVGVLTTVAGIALLNASVLVAFYGVAIAIGFHLRVLRNEEPWLASQFGKEWEKYRKRVPRWTFRLKPYC